MTGKSFTVITAFLTDWAKVPADWPFKTQAHTSFLKMPAGITGTALFLISRNRKTGLGAHPIHSAPFCRKSGIEFIQKSGFPFSVSGGKSRHV